MRREKWRAMGRRRDGWQWEVGGILQALALREAGIAAQDVQWRLDAADVVQVAMVPRNR